MLGVRDVSLMSQSCFFWQGGDWLGLGVFRGEALIICWVCEVYFGDLCWIKGCVQMAWRVAGAWLRDKGYNCVSMLGNFCSAKGGCVSG